MFLRSLWVGVAPIHYAGARAIVNAHIGVKTVDEMTVTQVKRAIQFVLNRIGEAGQQGTLPQKEMPKIPEDALAKLEVLIDEVESKRSELRRWSDDFVHRLSDVTVPLYKEALRVFPTPRIYSGTGMECLHFTKNTGRDRLESGIDDLCSATRYAQFFARSMGR